MSSDTINKKNHIPYLKFLKKTIQIRELLPASSWLLLEEIAIFEVNNEPLTVSNVLSWTWQASPATLHGRLQKLIQDDYLVLAHDEKDARIRYIYMTEKSHLLFKKLSEAFCNISESFHD